MQDVIDNIIEKISFTQKEAFRSFLNECVTPYINKEEEDREQQRKFQSVNLKLDYFFKNFTPFINEHKDHRKYEAGVEALTLIFEQLHIELDPSDCFILFHLRNLGKFKIKESKLLNELKSAWGEYKKYALSDQDFSAALRSLRKEKAIEYRKGNLTTSPNIIIRYR
jgi:hypothetical protein